MENKDRDGLDFFLFGGSTSLVDFKCFRGDRVDVSDDDIKAQIHTAFMQRRMKRAVVSSEAPKPDVSQTNVAEFVQDLKKLA